MPQNEFYSDNLHSDYPLIGVSDDLQRALLADAEVYVRASTGYRHSHNSVMVVGLLPITQAQADGAGYPDSVAVLLLQTTAATDTQQGLCFFDGDHGKEREIVAFDRNAVSLWVAQTELLIKRPGSPNIWGTVVEGTADLNSPTSPIGLRILPSRVIVSRYNIAKFGETSVVNDLGEVSKPPPGCEHVVNPELEDQPKRDTSCNAFNGSVRFTGGIQSAVSQDNNQNAIVLTSEVGGGELCGTEADPAQFHRTSAYGTDCGEVLRRINDQGGPSLSFVQGQGVSVEPHPELHRVVVRVGSSDMSVCVTDEEDAETEYLPNNDDGLPCGYGGAPLPKAESPDNSTGFLVKKPSGATPTTSAPQTCLWQWDGSLWVPLSSACSSPAYCNYPSNDGLKINQQTQTSCLFPATNFDLPVVNGDFEDEYPLNGWDVSGDVTLLVSQEDEPTLDPTHLPMVELAPGAYIEQRTIQTAPMNYVLQFERQVFGPSGELTVKLSTNSENIIYIEKSFTGPPSVTEELLGPWGFIDSPSKLRFTNSGSATVRVRFVSLVKQ